MRELKKDGYIVICLEKYRKVILKSVGLVTARKEE